MKVLDSYSPRKGVLALLLKCKCVVEVKSLGLGPDEHRCKKHDPVSVSPPSLGQPGEPTGKRPSRLGRRRTKPAAPPSPPPSQGGAPSPSSAVAGTAVGSAPGPFLPQATPIQPDARAGAAVPSHRCIVLDCQAKRVAHGLCFAHYDRWRKHGLTWSSLPCPGACWPDWMAAPVKTRGPRVDKKVNTPAPAPKEFKRLQDNIPIPPPEKCDAYVSNLQGDRSLCGDPAVAKGLCQFHYQELGRKRPDPDVLTGPRRPRPEDVKAAGSRDLKTALAAGARVAAAVRGPLPSAIRQAEEVLVAAADVRAALMTFLLVPKVGLPTPFAIALEELEKEVTKAGWLQLPAGRARAMASHDAQGAVGDRRYQHGPKGGSRAAPNE